MSYMLRDRPDGQVEIILSTPILIGIFPERDMAQKVCAFLCAEDPELPDDNPASFAKAKHDVDLAATEDLSDIPGLGKVAARPSTRAVRNLPAVIAEPKTRTVQKVAIPPQNLTAEQVDTAFRQIAEGQKIADVAWPLGLTTFQLQGMWAAYRKKVQKHLAEGGKQPCVICKTAFVPSVSNPDKCARCSHD